jgi:hypothetical protein
MYAPFLERIAASVPYYKGLPIRGNPKWPHVEKWFSLSLSLSLSLSPYYKGGLLIRQVAARGEVVPMRGEVVPMHVPA